MERESSGPVDAAATNSEEWAGGSLQTEHTSVHSSKCKLVPNLEVLYRHQYTPSTVDEASLSGTRQPN